MKRLHATALVAALAAASPAWADPPTPAHGDQVLTLTKDGKPHQYKVLKTYKHPSGGTAYEVKDDATGEIITVIEDATPEQIKPTLKPEVTTDVKTSSTAKPDPILQPKTYAGDAKIQKSMGADPTPPAQSANQYTRPPVPAVKRWFGWMQKDTKPATNPPTQKPVAPIPAPQPGIIEAAYHPDVVYRLIGCLRDDLLPSMREVAAGELASVGRDRSEAVEALIDAACHDPAPSVRISCVRHLHEMGVRTPACLAALTTLQNDRNENVRAEAGIVLAHWQQ